MNRATVLWRFVAPLIAILLAGCSGGSETLSKDEYRAEVVSLCEQALEDLENSAPTRHTSPEMVEEWAEDHRTAAGDLRALNGPQAEEKDGRDLARRMDEMAEELDAVVVALKAADDDALSRAVGAGARVRSGVIASCSAFEHLEPV
jgi:hypothetical protein